MLLLLYRILCCKECGPLGLFNNELEDFSDEVYDVVGLAFILSILSSVYLIMAYIKLRKQGRLIPTGNLWRWENFVSEVCCRKMNSRPASERL